jgi:hypothetical protein
MKAQSGLMLNALLSHFHKGAFKDSLNYLPLKQRQELASLPVPKSLPKSALWDPDQIVRWIHYSWFAPILEMYPQEVQTLFLGAFSESDRISLSKLLKIRQSPPALSSPVKLFFLKKLCAASIDKTVLPMDFLPDSPLNSMLELTKRQLVRLIDLLGLHDLAIDIRRVVDRKQLDQVFALLTISEQQYLRYCLQQQDLILSPAEGIQKWIGGSKKIGLILHLKGLFRLSAALSGQSGSLMWYLIHHLDTGRGAKLQQLSSSQLMTQLNSKQIDQIVQQVYTLTTLFLQQEKTVL